LYAIIGALPFVIVLGSIYYYVVETWNGAIIDNYIFSFFVILGFFVIFISFLYYFVLQTNLNLSYLKNEKLGYLKNSYFNFPLFRNYFKVMTLSILIMLIPFVVYKIIFLLSVGYVWWIEEARVLFESKTINFFNVGIKLLEVVTLIAFIYFTYKTLFSVIILTDESSENKFKGSFYYIKKSFNLTKGFLKWFKFLLVAVIIFIITLPVTVPLNYFSFNNRHLSDYIEYKTDSNSASKFNFYYLQNLELDFAWKDIDILIKELNKDKKYEVLLEVLNFLLIFGLFEMMILSFYRRELLWEKKETKLKDSKKSSEKKEVKTKSNTVKKKVVSKPSKATTKKATTKKPTKSTSKKIATKKTTTKKIPVKKIEKKEPVKRGRGRPKKTEK
jgi:hypothetical protein